MIDPRLDHLAQILVSYSTRVKPGDLVGITGFPFSPEGLPLAFRASRNGAKRRRAAAGGPDARLASRSRAAAYLHT